MAWTMIASIMWRVAAFGEFSHIVLTAQFTT
jgi:hypothetical protein